MSSRLLPLHQDRLLLRQLAVSMVTFLCCAGTPSAMPAQAWRVDETQTVIGFKIEAAGFPTTHGRFTDNDHAVSASPFFSDAGRRSSK